MPGHLDTPRCTSTMGIVTEAIRFGCFSQLLAIDDDGRASVDRAPAVTGHRG